MTGVGRFPPYAFTEHGAIVAATVLNSRRAVEMGVLRRASIREAARSDRRENQSLSDQWRLVSYLVLQ